MKTYRLKIPLLYHGIKYTIGDLFLETNNYYKSDESETLFYKDFIEDNPDIFELIQEPQGEVIEGYVNKKLNDKGIREGYHFFKENVFEDWEVPARLILNPKPRKEKEEYSFILHNEIIKKFRQSYYLSKPEEYSNHILCTLIRNEKAEIGYTKIKIVVEEE